MTSSFYCISMFIGANGSEPVMPWAEMMFLITN